MTQQLRISGRYSEILNEHKPITDADWNDPVEEMAQTRYFKLPQPSDSERASVRTGQIVEPDEHLRIAARLAAQVAKAKASLPAKPPVRFNVPRDTPTQTKKYFTIPVEKTENE